MTVAFILGSANTLEEDIRAALDLCPLPDTVIAANHAGRDFAGPLPHWVTLHTEKMPKWVEERAAAGYPPAENYWTSNVKTIPPEHAQLYRRAETWDGSSGLLGVTVALQLGYDRIILCGVPLDKRAAHYDDGKPWMDAPRYRHAWTRRRKKMLGKVKSMSGWTQSILGAPDYSWINS